MLASLNAGPKGVGSIKRRAAILSFAAVLLSSLSILTTANMASATGVFDTSCGTGPWVSTGLCKYDQAKPPSITGNCGVGDACRIDTVYWKGGTASGNCDPTNDIDYWYLDYVQINRVSNGNTLWQATPSADHHTNCNPDATVYSRSPSLDIPSDVRVKYQWVFVSLSHPSSSFVDTGFFYIVRR